MSAVGKAAPRNYGGSGSGGNRREKPPDKASTLFDAAFSSMPPLPRCVPSSGVISDDLDDENLVLSRRTWPGNC